MFISSIFLMLFSPEYLLYTLLGIVLLPAIIFSVWAQARVSYTFSKFNAAPSACGYAANQVARAILDEAKLTEIQIIRTKGHLNCYYNHGKKTLALSDDVYDSSSVAALGVAAHEVGHALQYQSNYIPVKVRNALVPVLNFSNTLMWPILIVGIILLGVSPDMMWGNFPIGKVIVIIACVFFGLSILFSLVTLPTEYNASRRAKKILSESGILVGDENAGAAKVLNAAALTYVAAFLTSVLNLIRILLYFFIISRGRRD